MGTTRLLFLATYQMHLKSNLARIMVFFSGFAEVQSKIMFYIPGPGILENRKYGYARMDVRQKTRNLLASFHDRVHWLGGRKDQQALNNYFLQIASAEAGFDFES